jgi:hypothetical protein
MGPQFGTVRLVTNMGGWESGFVPFLARIRDMTRSLLAILAFPFTLVEQSKGWRRSAILVLYALLALVICIPLVRTARLSRIPDPSDPFDVAAFRDGGNDDAFPLYQEAFSRYQSPSRQPTAGSSVPLFNRVMDVRFNSAHATPDVQAWISSNNEARDLWKRATARSKLSYHRWDSRGFGAEWDDTVEGVDPKTGKHISLRVDTPERGLLRWLGEREAMRLEKEGDLAGAWSWHNAALRYSRHVGMRTIFADRLQAVALHREACDRAEHWAADVRVDATMLRRALADALDVGTMAPLLSDTLQADYLEALFLLDHPPRSLVNQVIEDYKGSGQRSSPDPPLPRQRSHLGRDNDGLEGKGDRFRRYLPDLRAQATYYLSGEPERSKRLVREVYTNWLVHCDEPVSAQSRTATALKLFSGPAFVGGVLPALDLASELDLPGPARHVLPRWAELQKPLQDEQSRQARLVVTIAGELFLRERGKRPASPQELVGPYLAALPFGLVDEKPSGRSK